VDAGSPSPAGSLPLVRLAALQGVVTSGWRSHWVLRTRFVLAVSVGTRGLHRTSFPRLLALTGSSPRELRSSSESSAAHLPSLSPAPAPSLGLRSRFATSPTGVRASGIPAPAAFPSSAFRTPATVCSACRLVGLFHPTATSRVHPSGNVSRAQPSRFVSVSCPLVVGRRRAAPVARSATRRRPDLRAFIRPRDRGRDAGV